MMRSLYSAVSGLKTHQTRMDVIGNNIANVNTEAFKSSNVTFSEIMYQTTSTASAGNGATGIGGVNAKQIGLGVATGATQVSIETAGAAETTGNPFDLKLTDSQTTNFFVVSDGNSNMFTRAGSFYVDGNGYLCMTSTGYTLMGWQVDETTGQIKKDTVTSLQVMSPTNQTSSPESTAKAYISGVLDKNDSNLQSKEGYATTMLFYDDLGYAYTAKFYIQPVDANNGQFLIRLDDILDQNSKSIFAEGSQYATFNYRDLFGNTTTTDIDIALPNAAAASGLPVGSVYYNEPLKQYMVVTEATPAQTFGFVFPAGTNQPGYQLSVTDKDGQTVADQYTYSMFGIAKTNFDNWYAANAGAPVTNAAVGAYRSVGNLSTNALTTEMVMGKSGSANATTGYSYTVTPKTATDSAKLTFGQAITTPDWDGDGNPDRTFAGTETFLYDTQYNRFVNQADNTDIISAEEMYNILCNNTTTYKQAADGSEFNNGLYTKETYSIDPDTGDFILTTTATLPDKNMVSNLTAGQYYYDTTSGMYYYIQDPTVKGYVAAEIKEADANGNGYFTYTNPSTGKAETVSLAKAFGFESGKDTTVAIKDGVATGTIMRTNFAMNFDTSDGTFESIVTDGQTNATLQMKLLGDNFQNIQIDFSKMLNYNNGGTSTVKMLRGDVQGDGAGKKLGALTGLTVDNAGKIYGTYDNGNTVLLCQVAVAQFANASGLEKVGENCYKTTLNSGEFDGIGVEVDADGSSINTGQLEMSNVDLSAEFTSMIVTQRGFQANSRVITTSDTLLEELINLKR